MICHRLCLRLSSRGSFGESRRNGIWAETIVTGGSTFWQSVLQQRVSCVYANAPYRYLVQRCVTIINYKLQ